MKLLFMFSPIFPFLQDPSVGVGGVELNLYNIAQEMIRRNHQLQIVTPRGSSDKLLPIKQVEGELQPCVPKTKYADQDIIPVEDNLELLPADSDHFQNDFTPSTPIEKWESILSIIWFDIWS